MARVIDAILSLRDNFSATMERATDRMTQMARQMQRTGKQIQQTGRNLDSFGDSMINGVTLPIIGAGVVAAKFSMNFADGMSKVSTVMDETQVSLGQMSKQVINLSNIKGLATSDIIEGLYDTISAGIQTRDAMNFLTVAVKTAKGGFTDTKTSVDGLTTTLNSYGLKATEVTKIANQMMVAQNLGKTTFGEMASVIGNVTPVASSLGVSTKELFSSLATLTANGIKTSEAVTGLKAAYSNIIKPASEASKMADALGIKFNASHLKSVGWAKFLEEVQKKTGGNTEKMAKLFGSVEALNSVLALTSKQGITLYNESMRQMSLNTDYVGMAYEKLQTPGEKLRKSFNAIKNSLIQFGDMMAPTMIKVADTISKITDAISKLSLEQREMIVKFLLIAAITGPVIKVVGMLTLGIGGAMRTFGNFANTVRISGSVMKAIFTPGNVIVLGIIAIAVASYLLYKNWDKLKAIFEKNEKVIKTTAIILTTILGPALIQTGIKATITGAKIVGAFIVAGIQGAKTTAIFTGQMLMAVIRYTLQGWKMVGSITASTTAWIAQKTVMITSIAITKAVTIAQYALNLALSMNPIVWVIALVVGLIAVFVLLYKNSATVRKVIDALWEGLKSGAIGAINVVINLINVLIKALNKIHFKFPDWVPNMGGKEFSFNIPQIPKFAKGTTNFQGGLALVGEEGPELVRMPKGSQVITNRKTEQLLNSRNSNIAVNINMNGLTIREEADINKIARAIVKELKIAEANFGGAY